MSEFRPIRRGSSPTVEVEHVRGSTRVRITIVVVVGLLLLAIISGVGVCLIWRPDSLLVYIEFASPIVSGAVFGLVGFIAGQRTSESPK